MNGCDRRAFLAQLAALGAAACARRGLGAPKPPHRPFRALVIGGGYGGATAARYLRLLNPELDVTLVVAAPSHVSCPGSNAVIGGLEPFGTLERRYDRLAGTLGVRVLKGEVVGLDVAHRCAVLKGGRRLPYDRAVLSPGIAFRWDAWTGYDEAASRRVPHAWQAGPQTQLLHRQLAAMRPGGVLVIVPPPNPYRCPPGPYERASLAAHYLKRHNPRAKILIIDPKTQFSKQALFLRGWADLYPGMVEWLPLSTEGAIDRIDAVRRVVHLDFGRHSADVLNVIPPQKAGGLAERAGLTDASGWCPIDARTFASIVDPSVHVIGDACAAAPMPKSAFAANTQAKVAAAAIVDAAAGHEPGAPSLINHCYSFLAPDYAISVTGVYEYSEPEHGLVATSTGETAMDADRAAEARLARAWQRHFASDTFG